MNISIFFRTLGMALLCTTVATAANAPIQDGAGMFSASTVSQLDQQISDFTAQTGKQIVVVTVPSLNGKALNDAAEAVFQQQNINGMLIFIAKDDRQDFFLPDTATAQFFPASTLASIRQSMESLFKAEDYDGGITAAVTGVLNVFRAHLNTAPTNGSANNYPVASTTHGIARHYSGGISHVWTWIILIVIGWLILRSLFRAMRPRYYGGPGAPPGPGAPGAGGPGYGGYGYGPGYYGGGGGGFWSGLLGGLGGAWLGNEMFGNRGSIVDPSGGNVAPTDQGGSWGGGDAGGWANDAGQADPGAGSGGDWGGGGFGGGGDFGGGGFGGGDSGGGGGW
ncbi:MAG: TPM domain-containing protein [Candidatus Aquilonibacter sp.]